MDGRNISYSRYTDLEESISNLDSPQRVRIGDLGTVEVFNAGRTEHREDLNTEDEEDEGTSSIDENFEILSVASSIEDQLTWRGRMQVALHSNKFHFFIVALIVLDILIVLFELFLDVGAFGNIVCPFGNFWEQMEFCHFHADSRRSCRAPSALILRNETICAYDPPVECVCGFRGGRRVCIPRGEPTEVDPAAILHASSLLILTIFLIEVLLKVVAFRLKFFTHKFEVFDAIIVILSWMYDLSSFIREEAFQAASLLIALRLWRVVRIISGSVLSSVTKSNAELQKAKAKAKDAIHALHKAQHTLHNTKLKLDEIEKEKEELKQSLQKAKKALQEQGKDV